MATTTEELILSISMDVSQIKRAMQRLLGDTSQVTKQIEGEWTRVGQSAQRATKAIESGGKQAVTSTNQVRAATVKLQYQLNDIAYGLQAGTSPFTIMMQQGSQVEQAIRSMGGGVSALKAVTNGLINMINPISLGILAFTAISAKAVEYFTTLNELPDLDEALKKHAEAIREYKTAWEEADWSLGQYMTDLRRMVSGDELTSQFEKEKAAVKAFSDTIRESILGVGVSEFEGSTAAIDAFNRVLTELEKNKPDLTSVIEDLQAIEHMSGAPEAIRDLATETKALVIDMAEATSAFAETQQAMDKVYLSADEAKTGMRLLFEAVTGLPSTPFENMADAIDKKLVPALGNAVTHIGELMVEADKLRKMVEQTKLGGIGAPITGGAGVFNPSQTQLENAKKAAEEAERARKEAERAAERAAREATREAEKAAREAADRLNTAIVNQTKVAVDAVTGLLGKSETANAAEINAFLKAGGVDLDAATTAWCAAFVNSALAQVGIKGSGSQVATSFMNWGTAVAPGEVRRGDVLVDPNGRRAGQAGGHVGFATGAMRPTAEGIAEIEMISGNAANKVQTDWVRANDVIARRAADAFVLPSEASNHMSEEANRIAKETAETAKLQAAAAAELAGLAQEFLSGFISDLRNGKSATEALANALGRLGDKLLDLALNMAFKALFCGFGVPVAHTGGIVGKTPFARRQANPALFAGAPRYARGGIVGLKPGEMPIIAHRGELIVPKNMLTKTGGSVPATVHNTLGDVNIDMSATGMVAANGDDAKAVGVQIQKAVEMILVAESRPGGLLRRTR